VLVDRLPGYPPTRAVRDTWWLHIATRVRRMSDAEGARAATATGRATPRRHRRPLVSTRGGDGRKSRESSFEVPHRATLASTTSCACSRRATPTYLGTLRRRRRAATRGQWRSSCVTSNRILQYHQTSATSGASSALLERPHARGYARLPLYDSHRGHTRARGFERGGSRATEVCRQGGIPSRLPGAN